MDSGYCAVLVLLDLSAAFNTVDHSILLNRLKTEVGICDSAFDWFEYFFTVRSFSVSHSSPASVTGEEPQGSVLCPILFALYALSSLHLCIRIYADDAPLYMLIKTGSNSLSDLLACVNDTKKLYG